MKSETLEQLQKYWGYNMTKQDKLISDIKKELDEIKVIKEEYKENNELLKEKILEYNQIITSFQKSIPRGFFA